MRLSIIAGQRSRDILIIERKAKKERKNIPIHRRLTRSIFHFSIKISLTLLDFALKILSRKEMPKELKKNYGHQRNPFLFQPSKSSLPSLSI
jgi:hypothetical protein